MTRCAYATGAGMTASHFILKSAGFDGDKLEGQR